MQRTLIAVGKIYCCGGTKKKGECSLYKPPKTDRQTLDSLYQYMYMYMYSSRHPKFGGVVTEQMSRRCRFFPNFYSPLLAMIATAVRRVLPGGKAVFDDISLESRPGECLFISGELRTCCSRASPDALSSHRAVGLREEHVPPCVRGTGPSGAHMFPFHCAANWWW